MVASSSTFTQRQRPRTERRSRLLRVAWGPSMCRREKSGSRDTPCGSGAARQSSTSHSERVLTARRGRVTATPISPRQEAVAVPVRLLNAPALAARSLVVLVNCGQSDKRGTGDGQQDENLVEHRGGSSQFASPRCESLRMISGTGPPIWPFIPDHPYDWVWAVLAVCLLVTFVVRRR